MRSMMVGAGPTHVPCAPSVGFAATFPASQGRI